jgi:hypothetical protein
MTSVVPMRTALVFYWARNSADAEAKNAEPITANKPRPSILTEIPPQSTHTAAMRALPAESDGVLNPVTAKSDQAVVRIKEFQQADNAINS